MKPTCTDCKIYNPYSSLSLLLMDSSFSSAFVMSLSVFPPPLSEGAAVAAVVGSPSSELVKMPSSSLVAGGAEPSSL